MRIQKSKLIVLAFAFTIVIVSFSLAALLANTFSFNDSQLSSLNQQRISDSGRIIFTCHAETKYAFTFDANLDLSDGMNSSEAAEVATSLYEFNMKQTNYELKSVQANTDGSWTVNLSWGSVTPQGEVENHSHYYDVFVNSSNRTVEYNRCY